MINHICNFDEIMDKPKIPLSLYHVSNSLSSSWFSLLCWRSIPLLFNQFVIWLSIFTHSQSKYFDLSVYGNEEYKPHSKWKFCWRTVYRTASWATMSSPVLYTSPFWTIKYPIFRRIRLTKLALIESLTAASATCSQAGSTRTCTSHTYRGTKQYRLTLLEAAPLLRWLEEQQA